MNSTIKSLFNSTLILILAVFIGCGANPTAPAPVTAPEAVVSQSDLVPVEAPTVDEGLISYVTGIVDISDDAGWFPAEIGDFITPANSIKTGPDSSCEIQFGTTAVIRLAENTEIDISRINLTPEASKVGLEMVAGSVLAKVQKLSRDDSFSVKTQSAVCGVRGTEFSVSTGDGTETVFAVKEGSVAVLPPDLDVENLKSQVADKGAAAEEALEQLLETAPKVEANQELAVNQTFAEETREVTESVTRAVNEIAAASSTAEIEQKSQNLNNMTAASTRTITERSAPVSAISNEKAEALKQTDKMKILDIPVAATRADKATQPELTLFKIGLKVEPADARIIVDGESVGTGSFSALYQEGRNLTITVQREGYAPYELPVAVAPDSAKLYNIKLAALQVAEPAPAPAPKPAEEAAAPAPEPAAVEAAAPETPSKPANTGQTEAAAAKSAPTTAAVEKQSPQPVQVVLTTTPADASIQINGSAAGRGRASTEALPGTTLAVTVSRRGYANTALSIEVADKAVNRQIKLEPQPVIFDRKALNEGVIGLASSGNMLVASSARGLLTGINNRGNQVWSLETVNSPNENSIPVVIGNRVYFSGSKELVIAPLQQGQPATRVTLDSSHSHLFGRRAVPYGDKVLFPSNNAIEFINPGSGEFRQYVKIEGTGSRMTPGVQGERTMIATQEGLFALFGADGKLIGEVQTKAVQPVALAVSVYRNSAVFAGRRGDVAVINLENLTLSWEHPLSDQSVSVASDLATGPEGIYAFSREGTIYGLAWQTGSELFTPIRGASTPPAYHNGSLIYGTKDGKLVIASAGSGTTQKSLTLGEQATARPVILDGMIAVGTKNGRVLLIEPAGM